MNPVRLGVVLDQVSRKAGIASRLRQGLAVEIWPKVVGPEVARQTVAGPVRDRVLMVRTANPVLAHQLSLMEKEILLRFRKLLGGTVLRAVHLKIGDVPEPPAEREAAPAAPRELPPEVEDRFQALAADIPDQALAASFLRAARAWAATNIKGTAHADPEEAFTALILGDTWPTPLEIERALHQIDPERRREARAAAAERLRLKIVAQLGQGPGAPETALRLRGDLRRLALVMGHPLGRVSREFVTALLGPEAGAALCEE